MQHAAETVPKAKTCQVNDHQICYRVLGEGRPTLLLHGWGASWHYWQWLMPILARSGYCAYAPDLLGHGDSAKPPLNYTLETYLDFVHGLVEVLNLGCFVLAGNSLGGHIALRMAEKWPDRVSRLVLVNPVYRPDQLRNPLFNLITVPVLGVWALRLAPQALVNVGVRFGGLGRIESIPPSFLQQVAIDYKRATPHIASYRFGLPDLRPDLARVTAPTMVVWGERDVLLSPQSFRELVQLLPKGQAWSFPDAGHSPLVEKPDAFNRVVLRFLENTER